MPNRENLKAHAAAALLMGAAVIFWSLLFPGRAHAQLAVADAPTEASTASTASNTNNIPDIDTQAQSIAQSVTTGGAGGDYQPNAQYISGLDQQLFSGVNVQNFTENFP